MADGDISMTVTVSVDQPVLEVSRAVLVQPSQPGRTGDTLPGSVRHDTAGKTAKDRPGSKNSGTKGTVL